jgi:hypothetical protein
MANVSAVLNLMLKAIVIKNNTKNFMDRRDSSYNRTIKPTLIRTNNRNPITLVELVGE